MIALHLVSIFPHFAVVVTVSAASDFSPLIAVIAARHFATLFWTVILLHHDIYEPAARAS
jgi:hypothetical protein